MISVFFSNDEVHEMMIMLQTDVGFSCEEEDYLFDKLVWLRINGDHNLVLSEDYGETLKKGVERWCEILESSLEELNCEEDTAEIRMVKDICVKLYNSLLRK